MEPRTQCCRTGTSVEPLAIMAVDGPSAAISRELSATGLHEAYPPHLDGEASLSVTSMECCRPERLAGYMHAGYRREIGLHYSLACPATPASGPGARPPRLPVRLRREHDQSAAGAHRRPRFLVLERLEARLAAPS